MVKVRDFRHVCWGLVLVEDSISVFARNKVSKWAYTGVLAKSADLSYAFTKPGDVA